MMEPPTKQLNKERGRRKKRRRERKGEEKERKGEERRRIDGQTVNKKGNIIIS